MLEHDCQPTVEFTSEWVRTAELPSSLLAQLQHPHPPLASLHWRHHPHGRLSLDMGRGGDALQQQRQLEDSNPSASPSASLRFDDLPLHPSLASA